jgi:DNA-binding CsgD family transcriptional regulator
MHESLRDADEQIITHGERVPQHRQTYVSHVSQLDAEGIDQANLHTFVIAPDGVPHVTPATSDCLSVLATDHLADEVTAPPAGAWGGEPRAMRRFLRDLTAVLALPVLWSGREPGYIAGGLCDVLVNLLDVDCVYVRFDDPGGGPPIEDWRPQGPGPPAAIAAFDRREHPSDFPSMHSLPQPSGDVLRVTRIAAEFPGERGEVLVGSYNPTFPGELEQFLLRATVNQAAVALHGAYLRLYPPVQPRGPRPLIVGREREQHILYQHLDDAFSGQRGLVLISGESGIGKTALAEDLCGAAAERGALAITGRCYAPTDTPPYGPWIEIVERFQVLTRQRAASATVALPDLAAATTQADLYADLRSFLTAVTNECPLVLLLDDMHLADPASLDLLQYLIRRFEDQRLLILITYIPDEVQRDDPLHQRLPLLVREAKAERLELRPLAIADVQAHVTRVYRLARADARNLAANLHSRSDGNPFFLSELLRTLEDERLLSPGADGIWRVGDVGGAPVPRLLRQVIDERLARFGDEAEALLSVAAVIGQEVPFQLWAVAAKVQEEALLPVVDRAVAGHVVREWESGEGVHFRHRLFREVLYDAIPPWRRRHLHGAVADALLSTRQPDPDVVAHHFQQASDARAAEWLIKSGERAERIHAPLAALDRYETAIGVMDAQGAGASTRGWLRLRVAYLCLNREPARARSYLEQAQLLAEVANDVRLGARARALLGVLDASGGAVRNGLRQIEDGVATLEALPPTDAPWSGVEEQVASYTERGALISVLASSGRLDEAREQGERFVASGPASHPPVVDSDAVGMAWDGLGFAYAMQGEISLAAQSYAAARKSFHGRRAPLLKLLSLGDKLSFFVLSYHADSAAERTRVALLAEQAGAEVFAVSSRGESADFARYPLLPLMWIDGRWQEAQRVASAFDDLDAPNVLALQFQAATLGPLAKARGHADCAWQFVHKTLPDGPASEPGDQVAKYVPHIQRLAATLALDTGDYDTARAWLTSHDCWLDWMGAVLGRAEGHLLWARVEQAAGNRAAGIQHAQLGLTLAGTPRQPLALIAAHRLLGEIDTSAGRYEAARQHLAASLRLALACDAPYERALTQLSVAALGLALHDGAGAARALDDVRAICTPIEAVQALDRAVSMAESLACLPPLRRALPAGLTDREAEVLRLLAVGMTNREIADRLFVSPYTAKRHVSNILTKIGVSTRAAAARFAADQHLT